MLSLKFQKLLSAAKALSPLVAAFAIVSGPVRAAEPIPPAHYTCYRAAAPITADGKLDEASWSLAPWSADFRDIEGDAKPKPPLRTRFKMLWDDQYLYVAAELEDPHVWAYLTAHDSVIFRDNDFEIFIDPDGDTLNYYEFEMNARNTTWDLRLDKPYSQGGQAIDSWEIAGLKSGVFVKGTLNNPKDKDQGWTLEVAFPWKALREFSRQAAPPRHLDSWRMNFSRVEWDTEAVDGKYLKLPGRDEHNWVWSPQGVINMHVPERWGFVDFRNEPAGQAPVAPAAPTVK